MPLTSFVALALVLANAPATGQEPRLTVSAASGSTIQTGGPIRLLLETARRSAGGIAAQPPLAWIDYAETMTPEAGRCEARAERLSNAGVFEQAAREFNSTHVATLSHTGGLHVLDPRNGIRGARSLAHLELGGAPSDWLWQESRGLIWVALPDQQSVVAVDVGRWRIFERHSGLGSVQALLSHDGDDVLALTGNGIVRIADGKAGLMPGTEGAIGMASGREAEFWSLGSNQTRLHGQGADVVVDQGIRAAVWSNRADRLVAVTNDGEMIRIARSGALHPFTGSPRDPALDRIWLSPPGDVAVAWARGGRALHVVNLVSGRLARTIAVDEQILALDASESFVFVRVAGRGETMVLPISALVDGNTGPRWIAGGEAPVLAAAPGGGNAALSATASGLASWVDGTNNLLYFYHEGMNIPSGTIRFPGEAPDRLLLVGPLVRELSPGRFGTDFLLERPGRYVAVVNGMQPRYTLCQEFVVAGKPILEPGEMSVKLRSLEGPKTVSRGELLAVRFVFEEGFELAPTATPGLLAMNVSGTGPQQRISSRPDGARAFVANLQFDRPGTYLVMPDPVTLPGRLSGRPVLTIEVTQ